MVNSRSSSSWHLTRARNAPRVATKSSRVLESADRIMSGASGAEENALGLLVPPNDEAFIPEQCVMKLELLQTDPGPV